MGNRRVLLLVADRISARFYLSNPRQRTIDVRVTYLFASIFAVPLFSRAHNTSRDVSAVQGVPGALGSFPRRSARTTRKQ